MLKCLLSDVKQYCAKYEYDESHGNVGKDQRLEIDARSDYGTYIKLGALLPLYVTDFVVEQRQRI